MILFYPIVGLSAIDERKTDVYFANGILTEDWQAEANAELLEIAIKDIIYSGNISNYNNHIGKVTYAYNHTISNFQDLRESLEQVINVIGFYDIVVDWLPGTRQTVHNSDIELQVDKYEASIKSGHKVL